MSWGKELDIVGHFGVYLLVQCCLSTKAITYLDESVFIFTKVGLVERLHYMGQKLDFQDNWQPDQTLDT